MDLENMSKTELIELIKDMKKSQRRKATPEEIDRMREESIENDAYMERHGYQDYGYGVGCYGPL